MTADWFAGRILGNLPEAVCAVRASDATIVYANGRFAAMLGYAAGELEGRPLSAVCEAPEGPGDLGGTHDERMQEGGARTREVRNLRNDGSTLWCRARTTIFEHRELGSVWVTVHQDMEAVKELRRGEAVLRTVADSLPVGLWVLDETGRITYANRAGKAIWGGARYVGMASFEDYRGWWVDTGEPIAAHEWAAARAIRDRETSVGELIRIEAFDGVVKTILHSATPLLDENGELMGAAVVNEDVTALQEALDGRDRLLAIVAHELRGPLQSVAVWSQLLAKSLEREGDGSERRARWLAGIEQAGIRMSVLIEDLLDLARLEQGGLGLDRGVVDVGALVGDAIAQSEPHAMGRVLRAEVRGPLPPIVGDRRRVLQALENLIGNALKFTRPGDEITVGAEHKDDEVWLWVRDSGRGLSEEQLARVFERYWQGRTGDRRGAGIGLALVREIAEKHGGRAWANSQLGHGATFHLSLPLEPAEDASGELGEGGDLRASESTAG